jgi:hypothetical protein
MVSGGLHPELLKTDELEVIPAALKAIDWIVTGLTMMKGWFRKVYVPAVCGNHGRNTAKPDFKRYAKKNFDYLISRIVARHFADDPDVRVDIRESNDVHYRVYGLRFLLNHGDMLGVKGGDGIIGAIGPIMRGEIKKSGQSAALGLEYDINIMGHWHQELLLPRAIVCNTLKGFDEYARLSWAPSLQGQANPCGSYTLCMGSRLAGRFTSMLLRSQQRNGFPFSMDVTTSQHCWCRPTK